MGKRDRNKALEPLGRVARAVLGRLLAAYRTVSRTAVEILAGIPSIDLLVEEYEGRWRERILGGGGRDMKPIGAALKKIAKEARKTTFEK